MPRILLAEDDDSLRGFLSRALERAGYDVTACADGEEAAAVLHETWDLLLTDIVMPGMDGIELAKRAAEMQVALKIMFITGFAAVALHPSSNAPKQAKVLSKPFHLRELLARTKSVLRRVTGTPRDNGARTRSQARFAGWSLDLSTRALTSPKGGEVHLTTGEFDLLAAFVTNPNQVLSRDRLLDLARNREAGPFDRTIDVQVGRLRRKLEDNPQNPALIKTVRGTGYIFTPVVEVS